MEIIKNATKNKIHLFDGGWRFYEHLKMSETLGEFNYQETLGTNTWYQRVAVSHKANKSIVRRDRKKQLPFDKQKADFYRQSLMQFYDCFL